jgi:hypothetical protein
VSSPEPREGFDRYELRISGLLGPVLLSALPHAAVSLEPKHTLVLTEDVEPDLTRVMALVRRLVDRGVEVDSIRRISPSDAP